MTIESTDLSGRIKWFNKTKGYGFIVPDRPGNDVFVHISAVIAAGLNPDDMKEETALSFDTEKRREKISAVNFKLI